MCQPEVANRAIHEKRKINKKNRLTKLNELIFHQNQSLSTCISNWFNVKIQRGMLTTDIYMLKRLVIFIRLNDTNTDICG